MNIIDAINKAKNDDMICIKTDVCDDKLKIKMRSGGLPLIGDMTIRDFFISLKPSLFLSNDWWIERQVNQEPIEISLLHCEFDINDFNINRDPRIELTAFINQYMYLDAKEYDAKLVLTPKKNMEIIK